MENENQVSKVRWCAVTKSFEACRTSYFVDLF